jgi:hypothetical protein
VLREPVAGKRFNQQTAGTLASAGNQALSHVLLAPVAGGGWLKHVLAPLPALACLFIKARSAHTWQSCWSMSVALVEVLAGTLEHMCEYGTCCWHLLLAERSAHFLALFSVLACVYMQSHSAGACFWQSASVHASSAASAGWNTGACV